MITIRRTEAPQAKPGCGPCYASLAPPPPAQPPDRKSRSSRTSCAPLHKALHGQKCHGRQDDEHGCSNAAGDTEVGRRRGESRRVQERPTKAESDYGGREAARREPTSPRVSTLRSSFRHTNPAHPEFASTHPQDLGCHRR